VLDAKNPSWRNGPAEKRVLEPPAGPYLFPPGRMRPIAPRLLPGCLRGPDRRKVGAAVATASPDALPPIGRGRRIEGTQKKRRQVLGRESVLLASPGPLGPKAARSGMMVAARRMPMQGVRAVVLSFSVDNSLFYPQK